MIIIARVRNRPSRAWAPPPRLTRARLPPRRRTTLVVVVARRVHSPLWEDLPEASSYARIGSTRVLRGRPRNRLRRNRARGCSRISSADRAASIGHFPCPRPEDRCRGGASVLWVLNHVQNLYVMRQQTETPTGMASTIIIKIAVDEGDAGRHAFALREKSKTSSLL